ncbi:hypothetical protein PIB30_037700 [Stylosanthes scabra]|uniref:Uncharacterized protein n=1 Tax=Stylosanthes scabra TaxID=79078 RepID=A0ABU6YC65_9FABA|nr:hypothetical protein [Stylosanthes scabra]
MGSFLPPSLRSIAATGGKTPRHRHRAARHCQSRSLMTLLLVVASASGLNTLLELFVAVLLPDGEPLALLIRDSIPIKSNPSEMVEGEDPLLCSSWEYKITSSEMLKVIGYSIPVKRSSSEMVGGEDLLHGSSWECKIASSKMVEAFTTLASMQFHATAYQASSIPAENTGDYQRKVMKTQAKGEGKTQEWCVSGVPRPPHAHVHQRSPDSGIWVACTCPWNAKGSKTGV